MNSNFHEESKEEATPRSSFSVIFRRPSQQRGHRGLSVFSRTEAVEPVEISRASSMPSSFKDLDDVQEVTRSASDGVLLFNRTRKQRSSEEKVLLMRTRAKDLCTVFEMSDEKPTDLRKMTKVPTDTTVVGAPRFGAPMSEKQAAKAFAKKKAARLQSLSVDPLLTDRERKQAKQAVSLMEKRLGKPEMDSLLIDLKDRKEESKDCSRLEEKEAGFETILEPDSLLNDPGQKQVKRGTVRLEWSEYTRLKSDIEGARKPLISQLSVRVASKTGSTSVKDPLSDVAYPRSRGTTPVIESMGMEVFPTPPSSPGSYGYSVAPTEPNTPSPTGGDSRKMSFPVSPQGMVLPPTPFFELPDVC